MKKIKVGIVGLGTISRKVHIPILSTFKDVKIEAAAEADVERGEVIAKKWNIPAVYSSFDDMYESSDLDAVFICLPNFLHYESVKKALEHGFHVFCEKPMGTSARDARELVELAEEYELVLAVGYNRRLQKNYVKAANTVKSLKLGNILQVHGVLVNPGPYGGWIPSSDWFLDEKGGGVLYDSGCHVLDIIMNVVSDKIIEVAAKSISTKIYKYNAWPGNTG